MAQDTTQALKRTPFHAMHVALGGKLVDDNRATLSEGGVAGIREQLLSIGAAVAARGVAAGGERALRLFS